MSGVRVSLDMAVLVRGLDSVKGKRRLQMCSEYYSAPGWWKSPDARDLPVPSWLGRKLGCGKVKRGCKCSGCVDAVKEFGEREKGCGHSVS